MPREQINHPDFTNADFADSRKAHHPGLPNDTWVDSAMHVSWHPFSDQGLGFVQVALEADRRYLKSVMAQDEVDANGLPVDPTPYVWTPVLTRSEINKLIRVLRRARDRAYGSDE
jgi:hypothetical protein